MLFRDIQSELQRIAGEFPVVAVMGPRQSGKTTLVRHTFPQKNYVNLEAPDTRALIFEDPRKFFNDNPQGMILDEIQRAPELLSYIQTIVDEQNQNGLFILTGSQQPQLHAAVGQSLAGRIAMLDLLPFSLHELTQANILLSLDQYLLKGFYPRIYDQHLNPTTVYRNYIKTYVERDVRQLLNVKDLNAFQRFMHLSAARVGNILNLESLSNDVGVSANTLKKWVSILEASYLVCRLQPYFENFGKRLIKSPKLYFTDVGLIAYLLGIENEKQMFHERLRGGLFENLVLIELMKARYNIGKEASLFYYRDNHDMEIDIILPHGDYLIPIEIKSTSTFSPALIKNLKFFQKLVGYKMPMGFLVYAGETTQAFGNIQMINYREVYRIYQQLETWN